MAGTRRIIDVSEGTENAVAAGWLPVSRTVTVTTAETVGLTYAEAMALTATTDYTIVSRRRAGESGFWTVTEEKTVKGSFS